MPPTAIASGATCRRSDGPASPSDAAVRIVYQAVRTLVPESGVVALGDLTAVTRLDPAEAATAMNRLVRCGPFAVSRRADASAPAWLARRTSVRGRDR